MEHRLNLTHRATRLAALAALVMGAASPAMAAEAASATFASQQLSATSWQYSLTLTDTGTTDVGTFWFAWVPGKDFMASAPSAVTSATGWSAKTTHAGPTDGYAIQWKAGAGALLSPGESLTGFTFESNLSPEAMLGDSPFFPGTPVTTSFIYSGAPFSDAGVQFTAQAAAVPEPASLALMGLGALMLGAGVARRRAVGNA